MTLLKYHRWLSLIAVVFTLYLAVTGSLIDLIDLKGLVLKSSPYDANMQAARGDVNGPGDYAMIGPADYTAAPLPENADLPARFATVARAVHAPLRAIDLRMRDGRLIGLAQLDDRLPAPAGPPFAPPQVGHTMLAFDAVTGAPGTPGTPLRHNAESPRALRVQVKSLHRMTTFGNWALWINVVVAFMLVALIVTGVWVHVKQYRARARMGRKALLWKAQDWWRTLHRAFSVTCALFLTVLVASGLWLAVESLVFGYYMSGRISAAMAGHPQPVADAFTPLPGDVAGLARTTLAAYDAEYPRLPPRAIRLRVYAGYAQGVVISGEADARQLVYNARTGAAMRETEPGYPVTGFPFGWQAHQWAKQVHNGSLVGLTGRWISLLSGLALLYLSISGTVMYANLWRRRARNGKRALFW
jgi:uncharacterized iron-regulated membrane protein